MNVACPRNPHHPFMRYVKAGNSKRTGRSFNAFYICDEEGCTGRVDADKAVEAKPVPVETEAPQAQTSEMNIGYVRSLCAEYAAEWSGRVFQGTGDSARALGFFNQAYVALFSACGKTPEEKS